VVESGGLDHIALVREIFDAYNRRDIASLVAKIDDDFEWRAGLMGSLEGEVYRGRAGLERYFAERDEFFEQIRVVPVNLERFNGGVLVGMDTSIRGKVSRAEINQLAAVVFWFRGDKIARAQAFVDPQDARRAIEGGLGRP
jgi:ketosteroid isomerase-like protein